MATAADAQALVASLRCKRCVISSGLLPYATLAALIDYANGQEIPTEPQALLDQIGCLQCIPAGMVQEVTLAVLIDTINGETPPMTVGELLAAAACIHCEVPTGLIPYLLLQATVGLSSGTATLSQLIADSACLNCIPSGMVEYAILGALIDLSNGDTPASDYNSLLSQAVCLSCVIPKGLVTYATLETLSGLVITEPGTFLIFQDGTEAVTQGGDNLVTN